MGYIIEKKQSGTEFWLKAHSYLITTNECNVTDLTENAEYEFRVKAVNKAGESEPSAATGRTKITEYPDGVKPEITKQMVDQEGALNGVVFFRVEFEGKPTPTAKWFKNGIEVTPGTRFEVKQDASSSTFTITNLTEADNNQSISCTVINPLGKDTSEGFLKIKRKFI